MSPSPVLLLIPVLWLNVLRLKLRTIGLLTTGNFIDLLNIVFSKMRVEDVTQSVANIALQFGDDDVKVFFS